MRFALTLLAAIMTGATPALAQISTAAADSEMMPFFERANSCLTDFDAKARSRRLSVDTYRAAIQGACVDELRDLRGLYSLHLVRDESQSYLLSRFDANVTDARAKMISDYAMR